MAFEDGVSSMYRLKPIYEEKRIPLPTCMYNLASIYEGTTGSTDAEMLDSGADSVGDELVSQLEARQENLMLKIAVLNELVGKVKADTGLCRRPFERTPTSKVRGMCESASSEPGWLMNTLDVVVNASPTRPPFSIWPMKRLLESRIKVLLNCHTHSSVSKLPQWLNDLSDGNSLSSNPRMLYDLVITLIWKEVDGDCELMVNPLLQVAITGEVNLIRYLGRHLQPSYESSEPLEATELDYWLDQAHHGLVHGKAKEQQGVLKALNVQLGKSSYVLGSSVGLADIALWSVLLQTGLESGAPSNVKRWMKVLGEDPLFKLPESFLKNGA